MRSSVTSMLALDQQAVCSGMDSAHGGPVQVNTAAPREHIGAINGAGQTLASLVRAIGPALGGVLWGGVTSLHWPGAQALPFLCVSVSLLCCQGIYAQLPSGFCSKPTLSGS